jgi:protein ImuA
MSTSRADIMARLQKEILPLQGLKATQASLPLNLRLGPMASAFHHHSFPVGSVHEFIAYGAENNAATGGFISALLSALMREEGVALWISTARTIFPPALHAFGIDPHKVIFVDLTTEKDVIWAVEEALKCPGLSAVVGDLRELTFTASRRLQLAVESTNVTGFILRNNPRNINITASVTRWQITSLPGLIIDDLPGVGFPCWKVALQKVRNGKPGTWEIAWWNGKFEFLQNIPIPVHQLQKKIG